ncbi:MAG: transposase [Candidatus Bipolaricaulaceae bacterium]
MVKELLKDLMQEEHSTKANGYYTRGLLTLIGPVEDLRVPLVREGDFHPKILPNLRRTSLD